MTTREVTTACEVPPERSTSRPRGPIRHPVDLVRVALGPAAVVVCSLVAVPTLAALAAPTRLYRMARDGLVSGLLAYGAAGPVKALVGRERPVGAVLREGDAAVAAASPPLRRPT